MIQWSHSWDISWDIYNSKKKYMHLSVHRSTIYISQDTEANWVYTDRLMD